MVQSQETFAHGLCWNSYPLGLDSVLRTSIDKNHPVEEDLRHMYIFE